MRSSSLPGLAGYQDPRYQPFRSQEPRYPDPRNGDIRRPDPRNAEPRMITTGGPKKISDKPRNEASRSKPSNNREQSQEPNPSGGKKIPMRRKDGDNAPNRLGSRDWGNDSFPFPSDDRGRVNPFYQENEFSDNFSFNYPDQQKMMADRYF